MPAQAPVLFFHNQNLSRVRSIPLSSPRLNTINCIPFKSTHCAGGGKLACVIRVVNRIVYDIAVVVCDDNQHHFTSTLNDWLDLRIRNHTVDQVYRHWILDEVKLDKEPRWSIKADVLGWGNKKTS